MSSKRPVKSKQKSRLSWVRPQGKEDQEKPDMVEVANVFVRDNHQRKQLFGKFKKSDLPKQSKFASKATRTDA